MTYVFKCAKCGEAKSMSIDQEPPAGACFINSGRTNGIHVWVKISGFSEKDLGGTGRFIQEPNRSYSKTKEEDDIDFKSFFRVMKLIFPVLIAVGLYGYFNRQTDSNNNKYVPTENEKSIGTVILVVGVVSNIFWYSFLKRRVKK